MLEKRKTIDTRARQIVAESGVLWAVAQDQAKAEYARAERIVTESGVPWEVATRQARTEVGSQSAPRSSGTEQRSVNSDEIHPDPRSDPVWRFAWVANSILVGLVVIACGLAMVGLLGFAADCSDCKTGATVAGLTAPLLLLSGFMAGLVQAYRTRHLRWLLLPLAVAPFAFVAEIVLFEVLT